MKPMLMSIPTALLLYSRLEDLISSGDSEIHTSLEVFFDEYRKVSAAERK